LLNSSRFNELDLEFHNECMLLPNMTLGYSSPDGG
jgi:hypothetical protein